MRVDDVEEPVVAAATRTPFEATRRVFVLERVDTMNDEVANRLLKTLEEPPSFVHLILLTDSLGQVLETVVSRCQLVRFDPLPAASVAAALEGDGVPAERARACARLALGNADRARWLASAEGEELRARGRGVRRRRLRRGRGPGLAAAAGAGRAAPRAGRGDGRRRARAAAGAGAEGARAPRDRARAGGGGQARRPPGAHRGARPGADARRPDVPRSRLRGRGRRARRVLATDRAAALAELATRARSAPAARGRAALRGRAPVAGAERERGPGAVGARLPARGAGALGATASARRRARRTRARAGRR